MRLLRFTSLSLALTFAAVATALAFAGCSAGADPNLPHGSTTNGPATATCFDAVRFTGDFAASAAVVNP